jgi:N12 class adenine-specific DNA methylase/SAM-dependent methyltransferase
VGARPPAPARFRVDDQGDLAPSGEVARVEANLAALKVLRAIQGEQRAATRDEQRVLARWSGWGAVPAVFDSRAASYERFASARDDLRALLSDEEYAAAARNTLNAHYTDASYVRAIWDAVAGLGFSAGDILEPGCGSGNFLAFAPAGARAVGIELEPVTAAIAAALYPDATVRCESFADTRVPEGAFDLVVGNVPFGQVVLHDPRHNRGHAIHNHFIIKGLHLTRPGGLVAVLTSRYTMDAANPAARREIAELADLVGAVRLPTGAHRRAAGTDVVTDLLILRRREDEREPAGASFERSHPLAGVEADEPIRVNEYFLANPQHALGVLKAVQGEGGRQELGVEGDRAAGPALMAALSDIVRRAHESGLAIAERHGPARARAVALVPARVQRPDGFLAVAEDGSFTRVTEGVVIPHEPPARQAPELRALLGLRDTLVALLEAEAAAIDETAEIAGLRARLNEQYDRYVAAYGPINRFTWRPTGRVDPKTGEPKLARVHPAQGAFRIDPFANAVLALEHFQGSTQTATKASIFRQRVVARRAPRLGADTAADALAICLDSLGEVRIREIARLLGVDEVDARRELGTLVFDEPGTSRLVPAAEYLSGNVRAKLAAALAAAADDPRFTPNVTALTGVLPRDLGPDEIHAKLGAAWIDASYVREFLAEILEDPTVYLEHPGGAMWAVRSSQSHSVLSTSRWGTERYSAIEIAQALLEQRPIRIYDSGPDGERIFNPTATVAAVEKSTEMSERFAEWVWEHPERAAALARIYNERFNAIVPRSYDGASLSLPGLALSFQPRPHQLAAVARIIHEPAVGLCHEVGAGKTAEMVMGAMELRRLSLVNKPAVVVPNHMLEQFTREWLQLYPKAKVLAATREDLARDRRRLFVAKCATGDWDAIVMTRSAFERIPMSPAAQRAYLEGEVAALVEMIQRAKENDARFSLKRLERMKLQAEERLKEKLDGAKDPGISFEQIGIDYLFVDEAHAYKNLRTTSNIPGMAVDGSQRASDLHMKLEYLRERHPRVATLATATPIANSMGEAYTMQRYLRPDLLDDAGVGDFDVWAATFGETTTTIEVAPDGSGMRMATRFAKFRNVPELLMLWRVAVDIKTAEDLKLPVPALAARPADGQRAPETVVVPSTPELKAYVASLAKRADRVRGGGVDPSEDNMLKISSDGRAAALDLRLVGGRTGGVQKLDVAAKRIAEIYAAWAAAPYPGVDGRPHPVRGALQLVFSDLGTPNGAEWSVYEHLRSELVARGVAREGIRFVHEARNDREKGEIFAACREGRVSVVIGSTEKMGVGTNVQLRAIAEHHLDCPWRPADLAQRDGRILRQGNANPEVSILRYVSEGSFDAYSWQTVTRKALFIAQVMRGRLDVREIEDVGDAALSYNEVKALATGNPLLLDHARAQAEVSRLERLERSYRRNQDTLRWTVRETALRMDRLKERIAIADVAVKKRQDVKGDAFVMTVGTRSYEKRTDAGDALRRALAAQVARSSAREVPTTLGSFGGFPITSKVYASGAGVTLTLAGIPESEIELSEDEVMKAALCVRLENKVMGIEGARANAELQVKRLAAEIARARTELARPFKQGAQLEAERTRLHDLDEQMRKAAEPRVVPGPVVSRDDGEAGAPSPAVEAGAGALEVLVEADGVCRQQAMEGERSPRRPEGRNGAGDRGIGR